MGYSHGKQWSEDEIVKTLKRMVETLGMNTMPTHSEMDKFLENMVAASFIPHTDRSLYPSVPNPQSP